MTSPYGHGTYPYGKGHGTENDFVLLPDHDGSVHGALAPERVRALCDRRAGIGGDGVLRVIRTRDVVDAPPETAQTDWFMDYRNADGSTSQMCGNGLRVFVRYLLTHGLVDPAAEQWDIGTRSGVKPVRRDGDLLSGDLGVATVGAPTTVTVGDRRFDGRAADVGNPHAVVFVDDLAEVGPLTEQPGYDQALFPDGVNIEFVHRLGPGHVEMRIHERGVGETRSCGTGACAAMVATAAADGVPEVSSYRIDVPGGTVSVSRTSNGRVWLTGPAVLVAEGHTDL